MARSNSFANIMFQHISWEMDTLVVQFAQHKGDKKGHVRFGRHVYANPGDPKICPVLAVAVLIFSKTHRAAGGCQQLFEGAKAESRFSDMLISTIDKLNDSQLRF